MTRRFLSIAVVASALLVAGPLCAAQFDVGAAAPVPPIATATSGSATSTWEPKDYVLGAGVVVTLFLGIWNAVSTFHSGQRTTFINTVTNQRIKWIEQLRQDVSAYAGLVYHWAYTDVPDGEEKRRLIKEVDRLTHVIRLRLNPAGQHDQRIEQLLKEIPRQTENQIEVTSLLEDLTVTAQKLLKEEWEKVKLESKHGSLSERA